MTPAEAPASVVLLAGGFGTRIRSLHPTIPKPMIPVAGEPFLYWAVKYWVSQGINHCVVAVHHLPESIISYFNSPAFRNQDLAQVNVVHEPEPLGTGGAVRSAAATEAMGNAFFVANADSLIFADMNACTALLQDSTADAVVVAVQIEDASRFGTLSVGKDGRLLSFVEKRPGCGLINAGVYLLRRSLLKTFPKKIPLSMEVDVFPALLQAGVKILVHPVKAGFLDIGTPESLRQAEQFIAAHFPCRP